MLRDAAVTEVQEYLGMKSDKVEMVVSALKQAQAEAETGTTLPWFLIEAVTLTAVVDQQWLDLPADFIKELPETLWDAEVLSSRIPTGQFPLDWAFPSLYQIRAGKLWWSAAPSTAAELTWFYYRSDTLLDQNVENDWLRYFPYLLIGRAGEIVASKRRDPDGMKVCGKLRSEWQTKYIAAVTDWEENTVVRSMGSMV